MCGLAGFLGGRLSADERRAVITAMTDRIAHRGPDDSGTYHDDRDGLAIGFRRLSIVDLSPAGHQPMQSASGRYVLSFNGEVYNYEAIRAELIAAGLAPSFRGHSDSEVMLAAFEAWGVESAVKRFIGMFGIALWDREERQLYLIRDRVGVKPLYYGTIHGTFFWASELKALHAHPEFEAEIDRDALTLYFHTMYVPAPYTIYEGLRKVMPGTMIVAKAGGETREITYWSAAEVAEQGWNHQFRGSEDEAAEELDALLRDAVGLRMIADVPLGVFLSGGIDSSLVTAMMQAQSSAPVKTFSIGFIEEDFNEAVYAARVAEHLGTNHTEMYVTAGEAMSVIPKLPAMYDEPFSDSSQIPTHLVSALARRHVTVSLSGDGGDELFGGYHRYFLGQKAFNYVQRVPRPLRKITGRAITSIPTKAWDRALWRQNRAGERIHKLARLMKSTDHDSMYFDLLTLWRDLVPGAKKLALPVEDRSRWPKIDDPIARMMYFDLVTYLPDDILVKVDRASMAVSLEAREPLLDHRLIEFAWKLPLPMKVRHGKGKWLLRKVLSRYVPEELIERPKMGFGVPVGAWIRGPLRDWAESLLDERRMREDGFLDVDRVRDAWRTHLAGQGEWQQGIWTVLMFQAWREEWRGSAARAPHTLIA
ncbi:MAG TPA: asparagine synthase (glutamine-hydrolyzing) [Thermoanaerobaculia bacterium]|nr:asparagine synthase (glutamine-hydrolyzing) [Thermoanaerobaculia bacterium]